MYCESKTPLRGSYTVEAAVVFTFILLVLLALVYTCLIMYQWVILQSIAIQAIEDASAINGYISSLSERGNTGLYDELHNAHITIKKNLKLKSGLEEEARLIKNSLQQGKSSDEMLKLVQLKIYSSLDKCILKPDITELELVYDEGFVSEAIAIELKQEIKLPFDYMVRLFGGKNSIAIVAKAKGKLVEPVDYIRNIDLLWEYSNKLREGFNLSEFIQKLKSK